MLDVTFGAGIAHYCVGLTVLRDAAARVQSCSEPPVEGIFPLELVWVLGGRNSSVGSAWAGCPQRRGFDPPLGTFSGRGDFSLGVNMGSNSIPPRMRV